MIGQPKNMKADDRLTKKDTDKQCFLSNKHFSRPCRLALDTFKKIPDSTFKQTVSYNNKSVYDGTK